MEGLLSMVEEYGWKGRIVPIRHLADLREAILKRYSEGLIDKEFYRNQLGFLNFDLPSSLPNAVSVLIVAVPTPQMRIVFNWEGRSVPVIIPPTYVSYTRRTTSVQKTLAERIAKEGYHLVNAQLPLKTLAVCSGLAKYGRNNICYVNTMGSFLQLVGAFTDVPCKDDPWHEPQAMSRCQSCVACLHICPTKAISHERFLIHAEKCLTYHNEAPGDLPEWINPSWHHCLFGCMRCQTICPENKSKLDWIEDRAEFSETETTFLLRNLPFSDLPVEAASRIESLQINEKFQPLCRNLAMVLKNRYPPDSQLSQ